MAAELGVGVRVYVGWTPASLKDHDTDPRCNTGTIVDGPEKDLTLAVSEGVLRQIPGTSWLVDADNQPGPGSWVTERLLSPIDDGDITPEEEPKELEEPA